MAWLPHQPYAYPGKTAAPTVNDDQNDGHQVSDLWIDETNDKVYVLVDVSAGAAIWLDITSAAAADVTVDTTNFDGILSAADSDLQTALETIDDHTHALNEITNPTGDKTFSMTTRQISFLWTNPGGHGLILEASGAYSDELLHIHQHTGNPVAGTHLVTLEAEDSDVHLMHITGHDVDQLAYHIVLNTDSGSTGRDYGRFQQLVSGKMEWGPGGTDVALDTNLYRSAANTLKTDDAFYVVGNISTDGTVDGVDIAAFYSAYGSHNHDDRYYTETEVDNLFTAHTGAADPHTGYVLESLFDAHTVLYATSDNTPAALSVTEQTLVGRLTGGNISAVAIGISDNNIVQIDHASVADNDFAKFTANGLEGRSYSEVVSDLAAALQAVYYTETEIDTLLAAQDALSELTDVTIAAAAEGDYLRRGASDWNDVTVSQVLTDLLTVDGSGSGLDADKLDGQEGSYYEVDSHLHDGETIQADGINSDGGAFSFSTSGSLSIQPVTSLIINESGNDVDFRVEASGFPYALFIEGSSGIVSLGQADTTQGVLYLYGNNASTGSEIRLYQPANDDGTVDYYRFNAEDGNLYIGTNTNPDALKLDNNDNFFVTDGDFHVQNGGNNVFYTYTSTYFNMYAGKDNTQQGRLHLYGHGTGSTYGGRFWLYTAADHDSTIDYYQIQAHQDNLQVGPDTDTDALLYNGGSGFWHFTNGDVRIGVGDALRGQIRLYGHGTGSSQGGMLSIFLAADHDGTIDSYKIHANQDDLKIGPDTDDDFLKIDGGNSYFLITGGNVGIGTTSPVRKLSIKGSGTNTSSIAFHHSSNDVPYVGIAYDQTNDGLAFMANIASGDLTDTQMYIERATGNVGIGTTDTAAQLHIDQASTGGAIPVITLDQGDLSEEFIRFIGQSAADASQSLVDAVDLTTPGSIVGWFKVYIQDDAGSGPITDGVYYVPFYSAPSA